MNIPFKGLHVDSGDRSSIVCQARVYADKTILSEETEVVCGTERSIDVIIVSNNADLFRRYRLAIRVNLPKSRTDKVYSPGPLQVSSSKIGKQN